MLPDRDFFFRLAEAARAETLPRFRTKLAVTNKEAVGFDPVTEGDRAAEIAIRDLITEKFPDHGILGEEHGSVGIDRENVWVIDPIDGTRAFISGLPLWGTLIGLYVNGRATMGLMDQPFTGERYFADGQSTWYYGPDGEHRARTRNCERVSDAILFTTSPHLLQGDDGEAYRRVESKVRLFRYGTDCYAYTLLAAGQVDLVIENGLKPYDVGALIPIIEQAGGVITTWEGGRPENGGRILAAANKQLHEEAMALLAGHQL